MNVTEDQLMSCELCRARGCYVCSTYRIKDVPGGVCRDCWDDPVQDWDRFSPLGTVLSAASQIYLSRREYLRESSSDSENEFGLKHEGEGIKLLAIRPSEAKRAALVQYILKKWTKDNNIGEYPSFQVLSRKRASE